MGQITDRLPKANYEPKKIKRNSSEPSRLGQAARNNLQSAQPRKDYGVGRGLAPINEEDQPRSADPGVSVMKYKHNNPNQMRGNARGYIPGVGGKENVTRSPNIGNYQQ